MASVQLLLLLLMLSSVALAARTPRLAPPCRVVRSQVFCAGLSLSAAPVDLPNGVQMLDLSRNRVQNLSRETLAFHTGIRRLDLHSNKIHFIQPGLFVDMTQLEVLDLSRNRLDVFALSKLSVGPLGSVRSLDLSHNGLYTGMSESFLADSPALANLSLDGNSITRISQNTFRGSLGLRRISLHNNVILDIEDGAFDSLDHLTELDLSKNSISCITDFNLYHLEVLNLSQNSMELFHSAPSGFYRLLSLDLSQNRMLYFPLLPEDNLLEHLDVSHNRLQSVNVSGTAGRPTNLVFNHLRHLDLSYNQLQTVPECFFYCMGLLQVLNLSNNCLRSFSVGDRDVLPRVRVINLSFNALQSLTLAENSLQALGTLLLQGNHLATLDPRLFQRLPCLRHLQLEQNRLELCAGEQNQMGPAEQNQMGPAGQNQMGPAEQNGMRPAGQRDSSGCVSFSSLRNLQFLNLSGNHLRALPAHAFADTPLRILDLSVNPGLVLHSNSLSGLENSLVHLLLRENNISRLDGELSALRSLRHVDLSANRLTALPAWSQESSIESLNLHSNNLVTLESGAMTALRPSLKTLYVGSNPLSCCSNLALLGELRRSAVEVPDLETVTCVRRRHPEPLGLRHVTEDMCRRPDVPRSVVALLVMLLLVALAVGLLVKCCRARKHKGSRSFSA